MVTVHGITFPTPRPQQIDPLDADAALADEFAETLYGVAADFEELADFAWSARTRTAGIWLGDDAEAYKANAEVVQGDANTLQIGMRRVARAVTIHAQALVELENRRVDLVERLASRNSWRSSSISELRGMQAPLHPLTESGYRDVAATLTADYEQLATEHAAYRREVRSNDRMLQKIFSENQTLADIGSENREAADLATTALLKRGPLALNGPSAREWWAELSDDEREAIMLAHPELIGAMDGLPADLRDEANRILLDEQIAALTEKQEDGTISTHETEVLDNATHVNDAIRQAERYVDPITGEHPPIQLWLYDPEKFGTDSGAVAISVGDLDTADNVAVRVPGITTDIDDISGLTTDATHVYESARINGNGENSVASMIWLGYDAPGGPGDLATFSEHRAEAGGAELASDIDGLRASRDDRAHLTVIGHSYGSTTMGRAAGDHGLDADDLVFLGSPGGGFNSSEDLGFESDQVWAGRNSRDIVGALGDHGWVNPGNVGAGLGRDPADEDFGSTRFTAEDQDRSSWRRGTEAHSNYFDQDTESLYNIGRIVDGDDGAVQAADHVHDPLFGGPVDPEIHRDDIQAPDTGHVRYE